MKTCTTQNLFPQHSTLGIEVVNDRLWRVVDKKGPVLGHIERVATSKGEGFHARRLLSDGRRMLELGFFWDVKEVAECFR